MAAQTGDPDAGIDCRERAHDDAPFSDRARLASDRLACRADKISEHTECVGEDVSRRVITPAGIALAVA